MPPKLASGEKYLSLGRFQDLETAKSLTSKLSIVEERSWGIVYAPLDEADFEQDELVTLIERKYGRYLSDEKGVQKTINGLLRMGYSYGEIRDALKVINENLQAEDEVYYD